VGYDAGKKVKGRKLHALVDIEGLPLRIVDHSAGMQDRDGAGLVLDKIRQRDLADRLPAGNDCYLRAP
jgi:putative transposase